VSSVLLYCCTAPLLAVASSEQCTAVLLTVISSEQWTAVLLAVVSTEQWTAVLLGVVAVSSEAVRINLIRKMILMTVKIFSLLNCVT